MKRFAWIAVLSGVALIMSGCSSEKPEPQADTPAADAPSTSIDVEIEVPGGDVPADVEKPTEVEPAPAETPAAVEPKPDKAASTGKPKVHKAVGNALLKAVTGSVKN